MHIAVVGSGYVGLVTGACLADFGMDVTCVDKDERKINMLKQGQIPIYEPGLDALVAKTEKAARLHFTTELKEAVEKSLAIFIAVGTPPKEDGSADLTYVVEVAEAIAEHMNGYKVVVTKSTVPIGTGQLIEKVIKERNSTQPFSVVSNPEFLREGSAIGDCDHEGHLRAAVPDRDAFRDHQCGVLGTHQIRFQRLPRHKDHLYKRGGGAVRTARRRRPPRREGDGTRPSYRPEVPPSWTGLRRLLLPEGH
jgi:hypothetical protein